MAEQLICIGHRGAAGYEPENTLRSIRRALEFGVHGIEIDVQLVDGELIVFHDSRLERTTNGRGHLSRQRFQALRQLDAGRGERIPTLREVFETVDRRAFINIELKGKGTATPVAALIDEFVRGRGWEYRNFLVSSFRLREMRALRAVGSPEIPAGLLLARPTHFFRLIGRALKVCSVHPNVRFTSTRLVTQAHAQGWKVYPYTVNTPMQLGRMRQVGVDGVFTDFPDRVLGAE
ncbi:glycerophosphodiester phosphodiesterase [Verrucomicrobiota bacterium sgz303538]